MFKLDIMLFKWIYNHCFTLGSCFGFGAFEGFIIYLGGFVWACLIGLSNRGSKKC